MKKRTMFGMLAASSLVLAACGSGGSDGAEESASAIDCRSIDVIVPYSPGGGSDQQVRRLQPALEDGLGVKLNISYQTGGDGSQGWNALANADTDGCTIANVVMPNLSVLTESSGEDVGFKAEDFEFIGFSEYAPNMIMVAKDSKYKTFEEFVAAAKANPGKLTWNGVGSTGALMTSEMSAATGLDLTYVPVGGGVGDMIPQVVGGVVDASANSSSGLQGDQLRPIVLSAPSDKFKKYGDIPTFESAGYPGVKLVTSWGFMLPPKTPKNIVEEWNATLETALKDPDVVAAYEKSAFTVLTQNVDEARAYFEEQKKATIEGLKAAKG